MSDDVEFEIHSIPDRGDFWPWAQTPAWARDELVRASIKPVDFEVVYYFPANSSRLSAVVVELLKRLTGQQPVWAELGDGGRLVGQIVP